MYLCDHNKSVSLHHKQEIKLVSSIIEVKENKMNDPEKEIKKNDETLGKALLKASISSALKQK